MPVGISGERHLDTAENILQNYEILGQVLGAGTDQMVTSAQTHTTNIKVVTGADRGKGVIRDRDYADIDGLVTDERNIAIITGHADCNAIFSLIRSNRSSAWPIQAGGELWPASVQP